MADSLTTPKTLMQFNLWDIVTESYKIYYANIAMVIAIVLVTGTIDIVYQFVQIYLYKFSSTSPAMYYTVILWLIVLSILTYTLYLCLIIGIQKIFFTIMHGGNASLLQLFCTVKRLGSVLGATLLLYGAVALATFILVLLVGATLVVDFLPLTILAIILALIAGFYVYKYLVAYSYYGLILVNDEKIGALDALKKSREFAWDYVYKIIFGSFLTILTLLPVVLLVGLLIGLFGGDERSINLVDIICYYIIEALAILPNVTLTLFYRKIFVE